MSEGVRVGKVTDLKVEGNKPLKCNIGGHPVQAWKLLKDWDAGVDYANPVYAHLIQAAGTDEVVSVAGWEKLSSYQRRGQGGDKLYNPDGTPKMSDPKPVFEAQRFVEASESILGDVFLDYQASLSGGSRNVPPGENPAKFYPPSTAQGGEAESARAFGEGARPEEASPSRSEWADDALRVQMPENMQVQGVTVSQGRETQHFIPEPPRQSFPADLVWLNASYDAPYLSARISAAWAIQQVYEHEGDTIFGEGADELGWMQKARHLVSRQRELTEAIVKGEL